MSTLSYNIRQGFKNFFRNPLITLASVITESACIFLCCMFLAIAANLQGFLSQAETNVGITVFFDEEAGTEEKNTIRSEIESYEGVREIVYISAEEAWESFGKEYFGDDYEDLSAAFEGENPLEHSDSFEVYLDDIELQTETVQKIKGLKGVRDVSYSDSAVLVLRKVNSWIYGLSAIIIILLFAISVFLISNTIHVSASFRQRENEIMKMIGAKDSMIRSPFVFEGFLIGLFGSLIPLIAVNFLYSEVSLWMTEQLEAFTGSEVMKDVLTLVPVSELKGQMLLCSAVLGIGMSVLVSVLTMNRHLKTMR